MTLRDAPVAPSVAPDPSKPRQASDFRPDIQGLRAIAVGLVVLYHLWPKRLTGGYVGVDVFFVISGFLITSHIHREILSTGGLRVTRFWARRIRRLLPASLLVLALSGIAVLALTPATTWAQTAREIAASALYVQNWQLATSAVDYMAADNVPTVAQHFWSLSVEEQFYAVWPLLIVGLLLVMRLRGHQDSRRAILAGLSVIFVASLAWSIWSTPQGQAFAYMSTFTRVWEFAAGGITALVLVRLRGAASQLLAVSGVVAVVVSGYLLTESSLFPGWVALFPVLGTVALLLAGPATQVGRVLGTRAMTFIGDISYSIYLVHWPLIVVTPHVTGHPLTWTEKLVILAATVALAWASKTFVEDPLRTGPLLARAPRRAFAFAAAGMAAIVGSTVIWNASIAERLETVESTRDSRITSGERCLGPGTLAHPEECRPIEGSGPLLAEPAFVLSQKTTPRIRDCQQQLALDTLLSCTVGDQSDPRATVALVGDSHAGALIPTLDALGKARQWRVVVHVKGSCPSTDATRVLAAETATTQAESCVRYNRAVDEALLADDAIERVFVSSYSRAYEWKGDDGSTGEAAALAGFESRWSRWREAGKELVVIADVPATNGMSIPACIAESPGDPLICAAPRAEAIVPDVAVAAARELDLPVVDLNDLMCDQTLCYGLIGDVIVYKDRSHLSDEFATLLGPFLGDRID